MAQTTLTEDLCGFSQSLKGSDWVNLEINIVHFLSSSFMFAEVTVLIMYLFVIGEA
jgi:hypothetical protein